MFCVSLFFLLSYLDSNQDKQNQNLLCYHYTIGQYSNLKFGRKGIKKMIITNEKTNFSLHQSQSIRNFKHPANRFFGFQPQCLVENDLVGFVAQAIVYFLECYQFHEAAIVAGAG